MVMADSRFHQSVEKKPSVLADIARFVGHLIVPTVLLVAACVAAFLDRETPVSLLGALSVVGLRVDAGTWFTMGHVWIFALFLVVNLTSRRHGAGVVFGAVFAAAALLGSVSAYACYGDAHVVLPADVIAALSNQTMILAVALSVITGLLVAVVLFDLVRGRPWWKAPLLAPLVGGGVFAALFHALAGTALEGAYGDRLATHMGIVVMATLLMLVIYHALRSIIRPAAGYGGA